MEIAKYRKEGYSGEWYLTDFTMEQVEKRLEYLEMYHRKKSLETNTSIIEKAEIERKLYGIRPSSFENGDPRCQLFHSGDCCLIPDDPEYVCVGIEQCQEAEPITDLKLRALETEAIYEDWLYQLKLRKITEKLLCRARDALCLLEKDEDRGITKEEKKLVEEIDAYFGVLTPEHQGKRTFRLTEK